MCIRDRCWDAWLVQAQGAGETMRQARLSLLPGLIGVANCRGVDLVTRGAEPVRAAGNSGLQWLQQFSMPADRIAKLALTQCRARAFMQFARVPMAQADGSGWWLGDLRFGGGRGFSWLQLSEPAQRCDFWGAPWLPPRPELLAPTP